MAFLLQFSVGLLAIYAATSLLSFLAGSCLRAIPGPRIAAFTRFWSFFRVFRGNAPQNDQQLHQKYGQIVRTGPKHVSFSDINMIPVVYGIGSDYLKSPFYDSFGVLYDGKDMASMFSTRSKSEHKHLKTAVASKFSMTSLRDIEPLIDTCSDIFVDSLRSLCGSPIDLGTWLQWYAFDTIGAITFQDRFGFMEQRKDVGNMISGIEAGLCYASLVGQFSGLHTWLLGSPLATRLLSSTWLRDLYPVSKIIKVASNAMVNYDLDDNPDRNRGDFLAFFRNEQAKRKDRMSDDDLVNHICNNMLAGSDTTAISLRAIFYYIIKHPAVHKTLIDEIGTAELEGRLSPKVTFEESVKLPYLQAVIKEAMRMHPGVGFPLERVVPAAGVTICDFHIPGGTIIGANAWVIHQDKEVFGEDAGTFRPERWLEAPADKLKLMDRCFLSFGYGARTCIGKNISLMEMNKLVPRVLRDFHLEWTAAKKDWTVKTFWFAKQTDMTVTFRPRTSCQLER